MRPHLLAAGIGVVAVAAIAAQTVGASATPTGAVGAITSLVRACALPTPGHVACNAVVAQRSGAAAASTPAGYGPADIKSAYALPAATGTPTVAIVDANDDPNAESDLATYRAHYGLPACTTANGCFSKVNESGVRGSYPAGDTGWGEEISLDLDAVSATCPACHILLVEASSTSDADLAAAENTAAAAKPAAISNSYGGSESSSETSDDAAYHHPGIAITVSAGDSDYGVEYPAASPYVTAVGGTSLSRASNARGWTETVWNTSSGFLGVGGEGTGSGCSAYEAKPSWQKDKGCAKRTVADVSAVADPATGLAVYDTYGESGWLEVGGTSLSSPLIASVYALAGNTGSLAIPASYAYSHASSLNDVTSGSNGSCGGGLLGGGSSSQTYLCTAGPGYDGPTGLGTPKGTGAF